MNQQEKQEIREMDPKYRPVGAWGYFGYNILFGLPFVGFIILIVFACSGSNVNRRSYARSFFIAYIFAFVLIIIVAIACGPVIVEMIEEIIRQISPSDPSAAVLSAIV